MRKSVTTPETKKCPFRAPPREVRGPVAHHSHCKGGRCSEGGRLRASNSTTGRCPSAEAAHSGALPQVVAPPGPPGGRGAVMRGGIAQTPRCPPPPRGRGGHVPGRRVAVGVVLELSAPPPWGGGWGKRREPSLPRSAPITVHCDPWCQWKDSLPRSPHQTRALKNSPTLTTNCGEAKSRSGGGQLGRSPQSGFQDDVGGGSVEGDASLGLGEVGGGIASPTRSQGVDPREWS